MGQLRCLAERIQTQAPSSSAGTEPAPCRLINPPASRRLRPGAKLESPLIPAQAALQRLPRCALHQWLEIATCDPCSLTSAHKQHPDDPDRPSTPKLYSYDAFAARCSLSQVPPNSYKVPREPDGNPASERQSTTRAHLEARETAASCVREHGAAPPSSSLPTG